MRHILNLFAQRRLLALSVVGVILLTLALSLLQYRSLAELREKSQAAEKENLRQQLQAIKGETSVKLEDVAKNTLEVFAPANLRKKQMKGTEMRLRELKREFEGIEQVFEVYDCPDRDNNIALLQKGDSVVVMKDELADTSHDLVHAKDVYETAKRLIPDPGEFIFWRMNFHKGDSRKDDRIYIFRTVSPSEPNESHGFSGLALDAGHFKKFLSEEFTSGLQKRSGNSSSGDGFVVGILDQRGNEIFTNAKADGGDYESQISLSPIVPGWEIAVKYEGRSVQNLAAAHFYQSFMLSGVVLAGLGLGLFLILRNTAKEMQLVQAKSDFVSNVSHELKTPLSLIRLFAETLEYGRVSDKDKNQEYYRIINSESKRLTGLIDNILDFSKIEAGKKNYKFESAHIEQIVSDVVGNYEHQLSSRGFDIRIKAEKNLPPLMVDSDALSQALINLIDNAVKYSGKNKKIDISLAIEGKFVAITVKDHGIGIPKREQSRIFEQFYRTGSSLVHNTKGTGLGLALVRHIVEAHYGHVTVESKTGMGSRFTIHLPFDDVKHTEENLPPLGDYKFAEDTNN
ncbi:MAG: HAMP domain-containing histidine kinase [Acidobacteriota bacterium]|nr:HAMP domain-containing histidine kinase [Acidobacteriota bacterium]